MFSLGSLAASTISWLIVGASSAAFVLLAFLSGRVALVQRRQAAARGRAGRHGLAGLDDILRFAEKLAAAARVPTVGSSESTRLLMGAAGILLMVESIAQYELIVSGPFATRVKRLRASCEGENALHPAAGGVQGATDSA